MPPPIMAAAAFGIAMRPVTEADLLFLASLYASTRAEEVAATGWPPEMQRAFLDQQHRAQHQHYRSAYPDAEWLIVEKDSAPLGRICLAERDSELLLIDISLVPEQRGAGLGGALLADLMALAAAKDKRIGLHVERSNRAAELYRRLGFAIVEDLGVYLRMEWSPGASPSAPQ